MSMDTSESTSSNEDKKSMKKELKKIARARETIRIGDEKKSKPKKGGTPQSQKKEQLVELL